MGKVPADQGIHLMTVAEDENGKALYYCFRADTIYPKSPVKFNSSHKLQDSVGKPIFISDYGVQARIFNSDGITNAPYPLEVPNTIRDWIGDTGKVLSAVAMEKLAIDSSYMGPPILSKFWQKSIDEDSEKEYILVLKYPGGFIQLVLLDWQGKKLLRAAQHLESPFNSFAEFPEVLDTFKLINIKSEIRGSSIYAAINNFYRFISGKLYLVLSLDEVFSSGGGFGGNKYSRLESLVSSNYYFITHFTVSVDYYYELWSESYKIKKRMDEGEKTPILVKTISCIYEWDSTSNKFKPEVPKDWLKQENVRFGPFDFFDFYLPEIKTLARKGNRKQRKALHFLLEKGRKREK